MVGTAGVYVLGENRSVFWEGTAAAGRARRRRRWRVRSSSPRPTVDSVGGLFCPLVRRDGGPPRRVAKLYLPRSPEHPIDRRPADLERLGDVRGPNCPAPSVHAPARPLSKAVVPCRRPPPSPSRCPRAAARAALLSRLVLDRSFMPSRKRKVNPIKTQKVSRRADSLGSPFRWCTLRNRFMARFRLASAP
jgi:hypothetical protein